MAVLQAATAVELRTTQAVSQKLRSVAWSDEDIRKYVRGTLGDKFGYPATDPRSLEMYFHGAKGFTSRYNEVKSDLNPLRIRVVHYGYLPSIPEALNAYRTASGFLGIVS